MRHADPQSPLSILILAIHGIAGIARQFLIILPLADAALIAVDKTGS
jgi:hypothetical protein